MFIHNKYCITTNPIFYCSEDFLSVLYSNVSPTYHAIAETCDICYT